MHKQHLSLNVFTFLLILVLSVAAAAAERAPIVLPCKEALPSDTDQLRQERTNVWNEYCQSVMTDPVMQQETNAFSLSLGEVEMRYSVSVIGDRPHNGYPLYIAMHGGGSSDTPYVNDKQWEIMQSYYSEALECGVYIAVRGVRDTWDTHFNPESYPLYDRLIRYMIVTMDVDPNRVYLMGFSAGGDGVYAVAPRMADRFAAVNMSSGHPNGINLLNLYNLPIQLQAGEFDDAYDRNAVTAEYGMKLDALQVQYGGFAHRTLIHFDCGHNFDDWSRAPIPVMQDPAKWLLEGDRSSIDVDSYPPDYMDSFVRNPLPSHVIWDLSTRADTRDTESFYYLRAPYTTNAGTLNVTYQSTQNLIQLDAAGLNGPFSLLLNEDMVDFSQPIRIEANGEVTFLSISPDRRVLTETTYDRGDSCYQFESEIHFDATGNIIL